MNVISGCGNARTSRDALHESGSGTIQVRLTNTGNVQLSHRLEIQTTGGLTAALVEEDIVNMVAGDSQQFTVILTGSAQGSQQLTFQLTGAQEISTPSTTVDVEISASFSENKESSQTLLYSSIGIIFVALVLLGFILARSRKESGVQSPIQKEIPSVAQQPVTMCWSCRNPITGSMRGCPSCGARYHTSGTENCDAHNLENCLNCGASAEHFLLA